MASPASTAKKDSRRDSLRGDEVLTALKSSRETEHPLAQSESASPNDYPEAYFERPPGPDRAISGISTADSIRTIRPAPRLPIPELHPNLEMIEEPSLRSRVENLFNGTTKALNRLASRDRWSQRSPSSSRCSSDAGDAHGGPSLAINTSSASGTMLTPEVLRTASPVESYTEDRRYAKFSPAASTEEAYNQAQEINQRRFIQEARANAEAVSQEPEGVTDECPPSPDDLTYLEKQKAQPSASTIASSVHDVDNSSVSQNMSTRSFGMPSNASSPPAEGFLSEHKLPTEPDFMRTADTVRERPTGAALEEREEDDDDDNESDDEGMMMAAKR